MHVDLLPFLASDAVPLRNQKHGKLTFPHAPWVKKAADRNAFAKEVNTADIAPERLTAPSARASKSKGARGV